MRTCETCTFHRGEPDHKGRRECRALPPSMGQEIRLASGRVGSIGFWPVTLPSDGCGAHRDAAPMPPLAGPDATPGPAADGDADGTAAEDLDDADGAPAEGASPGAQAAQDPSRRQRGRRR